MPTTAVHPAHQLAREQLSTKIVDAIWGYLQPGRRRDERTCDQVALWGPQARFVVAQYVGSHREPSDATWDSVVIKLRRRIRSEVG